MRGSFLKIACFLTVILSLLGSTYSFSQQSDISLSLGRLWTSYNYVDYGTGFNNANSSNWSNFPTLSLNTYFKEKSSLEYFFIYTRYAQYYHTAKYPGAFHSYFGVGHIGVRYGYVILKDPKWEFRVKAGGSLGLMPDQYEGTYREVLVYPVTDSITRGRIFRSYTPVFPMISLGSDITFKINQKIGLTVQGVVQKGFIKITEYDIYYNNGSGYNDQRARQWGKGNFYGIQLGVKYNFKK